MDTYGMLVPAGRFKKRPRKMRIESYIICLPDGIA